LGHVLPVETLEDLLLDHILVQNLVVKLQRLFVDQLVVETFAVCWLNDVALRVNAILVALDGWCLMLALEFLLLLNRVSVVLHEPFRRGNFKLDDAAVV